MIRLAILDDALQIAQIHVKSWHETYTGLIKQEVLDGLSVEKRLRLWQILVNDENHKIFVYEQEGQIQGFLDGYLNPNNNIAEIKAFYFLKEIKGQGIGRAMFEQFYQFANSAHYQRLQLGVINQNPSRFFYEKMGGYVIDEKDISEYGKGISELFYQWDIHKL